MNRSRLFIQTLNDLSKRSEWGNNEEYDILRGSGLLRQLLIDGGNLVDMINRDRHLSLTFEVNNVPPPADSSTRFWAVIDSFDPDSFQENANRSGTVIGQAAHYTRALTDEEIREMSQRRLKEIETATYVSAFDKQRMLNLTVLVYEGHQFSVRELIKYAANLLGGVHAGKAEDKKDEVMVALSNYVQIEGMDPVIRSLKAIGRVVVKGLIPLKEQVENDLGKSL